MTTFTKPAFIHKNKEKKNEWSELWGLGGDAVGVNNITGITISQECGLAKIRKYFHCQITNEIKRD